jgi:two-component system sensor histidine kinase RegB
MNPESSILVAPVPNRRVMRSRTLIRLRWFAIVGQIVVTLVVRLGFGYELPVGALLLAVAAAVIFNLYQILSMPRSHALTPRELTAALVFDTAQISTVLFLTGGIQNPFAVWLVLPTMLAAYALSVRYASVVFVAVILALTLISVFHYPLPWTEVGALKMPWIFNLGTWLALVMGAIFTTFYAYQMTVEQLKLTSALDAAQRVLAREERLTALGGLAAAAAHELGTPLATIQVTAREMERELQDPALKEDAKLLISQTQRCQAILRRLADIGDGGDARHSILSLDEILREAAKPFLNQTDVHVELRLDPTSATRPPERLQRLPAVIYGLRTLIENAVKFAGNTLVVEARWDTKLVSVVIEDDGPGFPAEILDRLGEPFSRRESSRAQPAKAGLGLGFFIAKTLLERTGARLVFGNGRQLGGAWVEVTWPLANLRAAPISKTDDIREDRKHDF